MRILGRYVLTLAMIGVLSAVTSPDWRPRSVVGWLGVAPVVVLTYFSAEWAWEAIVSPQRGRRLLTCAAAARGRARVCPPGVQACHLPGRRPLSRQVVRYSLRRQAAAWNFAATKLVRVESIP